jgi:hypothetical protein
MEQSEAKRPAISAEKPTRARAAYCRPAASFPTKFSRAAFMISRVRLGQRVPARTAYLPLPR